MKNLKDFLNEDFTLKGEDNINNFKYIPETADIVHYFELEELCDANTNQFKRVFISEKGIGRNI